MEKVLLTLAGVFMGLVGYSPPLRAATTTFTVGTGNDTVFVNGTVTIPITVSGFNNLEGAQFSLTWNTGVLSYQAVTDQNSTLAPNNYFNTGTAGSLGWLWFTVTPTTLTDGTEIFDVEFTAVGSEYQSTQISFGNSPTPIKVVNSTGGTNTVVTVNDTVTIVPEPVSWALGLFGCVFLGTATVRWVSGRRRASKSA